ncbi:MAG: hypothetical protein HY718_05540 [Planctomycetes bacterium]|nr:hypothetical protein [Planctomycetota bacterium]
MYRLLSVGIVLLWVTAMAALFVRDVYPAWTAQDAPPMTKEQLARLDQRQQQMAICDAGGKRLGTAWSDISSAGGNTSIRGTVHLEGIALVPVLLVETSTDFDPQGELDSFNLDVFGVPATTIKVRGERHGIYFPCEIQIGPLFRQANLEMAASRLLGDAFRPFNYLPALKVGQSWRMQVIDPVSAALGGGTRFTAVVARVTGKETIEYRGRPIECFVVETSPGRAKAWVDAEGCVFRQQVELPGLGRLIVSDEPYDDEARTRARRRVRRGNDEGEHVGAAATIKEIARPIEVLRTSITNVLGGGDHGGND